MVPAAGTAHLHGVHSGLPAGGDDRGDLLVAARCTGQAAELLTVDPLHDTQVLRSTHRARVAGRFPVVGGGGDEEEIGVADLITRDLTCPPATQQVLSGEAVGDLITAEEASGRHIDQSTDGA